MTTNTAPRIWFTRIFSAINVASFGLSGTSSELIGYVEAFRDHVPYDGSANEFEPRLLRPRRKEARIPKANADAFIIFDGLLVISPKLRDVLVQFDLGQTELTEVSWRNWRDETPSSRPPHYLFHVTEAKPTLIPEQSENIEQVLEYRQTEPKPDAPWRPIDLPDDLAVMASSADGVDIWHDPNLQNRVFFSDRLRRAVEAADLNAKDFTLQEARVIG